MRALKLDYQDTRTTNPFSALLLAAGVIVSLVLGWHYQSLNQKISDWEFKVAEMERTTHRSSNSNRHQPIKGENVQEIKYANTVIRQIALPWENLFIALESVKNDKVAVLGIEPDAKNGVVKISAETKAPEEMLNYLKSLQALGTLTNVFLASHQIQERDPEKPVRFAVTAGWATPR